MGIAVSSGAVLRALNKQHGPNRMIRSSVGVIEKVPYEPDATIEHKNLPYKYVKLDPLDGYKYVENSIKWLVRKVASSFSPITSIADSVFQGDIVADGEIFRHKSKHTFDTKPGQVFTCEEILFESEECTESNYPRNHEKNKGMYINIINIMASCVLPMITISRQMPRNRSISDRPHISSFNSPC